MIWYTHVNKHVIARNAKNGTSDPAVRFQKGKYGAPTYAHRVFFKSGELIYSPHEPILPCGARLVIASEDKPEVLA